METHPVPGKDWKHVSLYFGGDNMLAAFRQCRCSCIQLSACVDVSRAPADFSDWMWNYCVYLQRGPTCPLKASMMKCSAWGWTHSIHFCTTWLPFWSLTHFNTWPSNSRTISLYREEEDDDEAEQEEETVIVWETWNIALKHFPNSTSFFTVAHCSQQITWGVWTAALEKSIEVH